jgi:hypothetical protein
MTKKTLITTISILAVCLLAVGTAYLLRHRMASVSLRPMPISTKTPLMQPKGILQERAFQNAKKTDTSLSESQLTPPTTSLSSPPQDYTVLSSANKTSQSTQASASLRSDSMAQSSSAPKSGGVGGGTN